MSADLFFQKVKTFLAAVSIVLMLAFGGYANTLHASRCLDLGINFYIVGVSQGGVEACIQQVSLSGGAGYLIEDMVALSVYFSQEDAIKVGENAQKNYAKTKIFKMSTDEILVKSNDYKNTENMLKSLYAHIRMLAEVALLLDEGGTQDRAKAEIACLAQSVDTLSSTYRAYGEAADFCKQMSSWLAQKCKEVLYSQAIRYQVCVLADRFCGLVSAHSV